MGRLKTSEPSSWVVHMFKSSCDDTRIIGTNMRKTDKLRQQSGTQASLCCNHGYTTSLCGV